MTPVRVIAELSAEAGTAAVEVVESAAVGRRTLLGFATSSVSSGVDIAASESACVVTEGTCVLEVGGSQGERACSGAYNWDAAKVLVG